jgi:hypothetical protein
LPLFRAGAGATALALAAFVLTACPTEAAAPSVKTSPTVKTVNMSAIGGTNVYVAGSTIDLAKSFTVTVTGLNDPEQTVTWTVAAASGSKKPGTSVSGGVLSIANDEAAPLKITAASTVDTGKSSSVTLTKAALIGTEKVNTVVIPKLTKGDENGSEIEKIVYAINGAAALPFQYLAITYGRAQQIDAGYGEIFQGSKTCFRELTGTSQAQTGRFVSWAYRDYASGTAQTNSHFFDLIFNKTGADGTAIETSNTTRVTAGAYFAKIVLKKDAVTETIAVPFTVSPADIAAARYGAD